MANFKRAERFIYKDTYESNKPCCQVRLVSTGKRICDDDVVWINLPYEKVKDVVKNLSSWLEEHEVEA